MNETPLPDSPTTSRFGWPRPLRRETFARLQEANPTGSTRIVFLGENRDFPIIRIPIGLPKYRLENGRTASLQAEALARDTTLRRDLFTGDPELWESQEAQHKLLLQLSKQSDLDKYFEDISNSQVDAILLDENGFVVNGNRRLSTWRELVHKDSKKYARFAYVDVSVLPHCSDREIDLLEATMQIEKDIKADYNWDAQANMMLAKQKRDKLSNKELSDIYKMKEPQVEELLDMRAYADEYLRSRGQSDLWSLVSDQQFGFRRLVEGRRRMAGLGDQELFKQAAFVLIDKPEEAGGRLYDAIPAIAAGLDAVKNRLREEFEPQEPGEAAGLDELFGGGGATAPTGSSDVALAGEIQKPENAARARAIIVEVIESQKQLKKDSKTSGFLLTNCARANALLTTAVKAGLRAESKRKGVAQQLDEIEAQVVHIRRFLAEHVKD